MEQKTLCIRFELLSYYNIYFVYLSLLVFVIRITSGKEEASKANVGESELPPILNFRKKAYDFSVF